MEDNAARPGLYIIFRAAWFSCGSSGTAATPAAAPHLGVLGVQPRRRETWFNIRLKVRNMKATRILLFLSPLLWFVPPLIPMNEAPLGLALANSFYRGLLGQFPANALMAFLCYTYANQLGRESWYWIIISLRLPYLAPFILAFVPPKYGSAADTQRRGGGRPMRTKAVEGPFNARFPLLGAYLPNLPEAVRTEARVRMDPVPANFEFSVFAGPSHLDAFLAGAAARGFTVWTNAESGGTRVFGAGLVDARALSEVNAWLLAAAPERKIATALHPAEGPTKYFEYYPSAN